MSDQTPTPAPRKRRTAAKAKPEVTIDITPKSTKLAKTKGNVISATPMRAERPRTDVAPINIMDKASISSYGVDVQRKLGAFSSTMLQQVKAKDAGDVGEAINRLMNEIKRVDVDPTDQPNMLVRALSFIPFFGSMVDKGEKIMSRYESVGDNINDIVAKMEKSRHSLMRDNSSLDVMYKQQVDYIYAVEDVIQVGKDKLEEMRTITIPALKAEIEANGTEDYSTELEELNVLTAAESRLDKKVHDLEISRVVALQSLPQIRIIQENNDVLMEKVQGTIHTTIPLWRQQVALALSLNTQQGVAEIDALSNKMTNDLLTKNSMLLKTNSINIAKQNEKSVVDMETLRNVNKDIMETLTQVVRIKEEGHIARLAATKELEQIEQQFVEVALNVVTKIEEGNARKAKQLGA